MYSYDRRKEKIGNRIKEEREKRKLTRSKLLLKIDKSAASHKSVAAWENGERLPELDTLVALASFFDCDIGYLLCDYDEKRYYTADVSEQTGLSIEAIERVADMRRFSDIPTEVLSAILTHPDTEELLHKIYELAQIKNAHARIMAMQESSKQSGAYADNIKAQIVSPEIVEKEEGKLHRISMLFNNISEKIAEQISCTPNVSRQGANIAERLLHPGKWIQYERSISEMISETFSEEDTQNG